MIVLQYRQVLTHKNACNDSCFGYYYGGRMCWFLRSLESPCELNVWFSYFLSLKGVCRPNTKKINASRNGEIHGKPCLERHALKTSTRALTLRLGDVCVMPWLCLNTCVSKLVRVKLVINKFTFLKWHKSHLDTEEGEFLGWDVWSGMGSLRETGVWVSCFIRHYMWRLFHISRKQSILAFQLVTVYEKHAVPVSSDLHFKRGRTAP